MTSILRRRPSAATIISCIALFCALGGVSYGFATGSIGSRELENNSVRGKDVRQSTLKGGDVKNESLGGADVGPDSLSGADVDESSLDKVPAAVQADSAATASSAGNADTVGGVPADALTLGRSATDGVCEPGAGAIDCVHVTLALPRSGRVLVVTGGQWHSDDAAASSVHGDCRIVHNGANLTGTADEGSVAHLTDNDHPAALATRTIVTDVLSAGEHDFALRCSNDAGDMDFTQTRISAVLLGSG